MKEKEDKVALKAFNEDEEDFEEIGVPVEKLGVPVEELGVPVEEIGVPVEELVDVHDLSRFNDVAKV